MCASVFVCVCDRERGKESGVNIEKQRSSWRAFVKNNRKEQWDAE